MAVINDIPKYRSLMNNTTFTFEDLLLLDKAASLGDIEVIKHCEKYNIYCSNLGLSWAVDNKEYEIINYISKQDQAHKVLLPFSNELIRTKNKKMLLYLYNRNLLSYKSISQFIKDIQ